MGRSFQDLFGVRKFIIGGVHLLPLPGTPGYDSGGGMDRIFHRAREDALRLIEGGVDAILFANEADAPYQTQVGPEIPSAMTSCIAGLKNELTVPFGVNMLLDPIAGVAVAHATGGKFVRGYFSGGYVGDMGIMNTRAAEALRFRRLIGAEDVRLINNLTCAFGVPLAFRDLAALVHGAVFHSRVDALAVSGQAAGFAADLDALSKVRQVSREIAVLVGTGVTKENVRSMLQVADGAIVASSLNVGGMAMNPVDLDRVKEFMAVVKAFRQELEEGVFRSAGKE
ncbi:MAG: BtpA/SgcQ family protein [Deltaproteobacteria bacterium]|nr:MAG: BtpA/SgcQ family protein [Deltaproteobacteria bacterium]